MRREQADHALQTAALVCEAYLQLILDPDVEQASLKWLSSAIRKPILDAKKNPAVVSALSCEIRMRLVESG
jgi:hypothetical protein